MSDAGKGEPEKNQKRSAENLVLDGSARKQCVAHCATVNVPNVKHLGANMPLKCVGGHSAAESLEEYITRSEVSGDLYHALDGRDTARSCSPTSLPNGTAIEEMMDEENLNLNGTKDSVRDVPSVTMADAGKGEPEKNQKRSAENLVLDGSARKQCVAYCATVKVPNVKHLGDNMPLKCVGGHGAAESLEEKNARSELNGDLYHALDGRDTSRNLSPATSLPNGTAIEEMMDEENLNLNGTKDSVSDNTMHLNLLAVPPLVIFKIWRLLCNDSDRIKMRLACPDWHEELPELTSPRPWVIGSKMEDRVFHCISNNKLEELKFKCNVPDCCFAGSSRNFLIIEESQAFSLWNPSDGTTVPLPLETYNKVVMPEISDPYAFAHSSGKTKLSHGRPREHGSWKPAFCLDRSIKDICQSGDDFYAVNSSFRLYKLDQETSNMVNVGPQQRSDEILKLFGNGGFPDHMFLADLNGELIIIALGRNLRRVQLFKVSWIDHMTSSLVLIDDLGGWSLFLGNNQSIALHPREFPGISGNSLYIAVEPVLEVNPTVQIYNLQTRTVVDADYPGDKLGTPFFYHPSSVLADLLCE